MQNDSAPRFSRRQVIGWFAAAGAAMSLSEMELFAVGATPAVITSKGYGTDPDLTKFYNPGDVWPLTLDEKQRGAVKAMCDLIMPADDLGPAASAVGVPEFIDEWVSAPYPTQQADRPMILEGLAWIDTEAQKRFTKEFASLSAEQQRAICDDICNPATAKPEFKKAATFFRKIRSLTSGAYFSTPPGWQAIGYVGNTPLATFDGPPKEVLERLGVEQTVQ